jgi:hypothetical protein
MVAGVEDRIRGNHEVAVGLAADLEGVLRLRGQLEAVAHRGTREAGD